ncbi:MAG: bacteriohemerythrin [Candidatus Kuenenia sp.]|nr:bacteriohemerythrin [Candidatus Kuenenia hertensis]
MKFLWSDDLATGILSIDNQHKEIFIRVNRFLGEVERGNSKKAILDILDFLSEYVVKHFYDEELLMLSEQYNGLRKHKDEHLQFKKDILALGKKINDNGITTNQVLPIQQQVCGWLTKHIFGEDKKIAVFIRNKNKDHTEDLKKQIAKLVEIGRALSGERNLDKLLEMIVDEAREFTNADAGTLYIKEDDCLKFKILQNVSMKTRMGGCSGNEITFPPVEINESNVSAYVAINDVSVNIPDVYDSELFDFTGPKKFDAATKYRTKSMLVVPMKNHEDDVIGVLQLINALDKQTGEIVPFSVDYENLIHSLASQAAVAFTNAKLIKDMEVLFSSFVKVMATAIDEKSPVTGGHIQRVADLTMMMAKTINEQTEGPFADIFFNDDQMHELRTAAWMHDIGKVTTPVNIVEKGNKLEAIFDRIHYIELRFNYLMQQVEKSYFQKKLELLEKQTEKEENEKLEEETRRRINELEEMKEFVLRCNKPGEFLEDEKLERLKKISKLTYRDANGNEQNYLSEDELKNLSIRKGSITEEERKIMQNHAVVTMKMLEQIPFTKKLKNVPFFAGTHHECINGKGYPLGIKGDDIPFEGRLMAVVDITEALTAADRPYKKAMPLEKVYQILGSMVNNGELDKDIVELMIKGKVYERYLEEKKKEEK